MENKTNYNINLNVKFNHQELIDIPAIVNENREKWFNQTLTKVNDSVVRIGILEGEFHWHKHDNDDEFFFVYKGEIKIWTERGDIELKAGEGITIPKNLKHKPIARIPSFVLMIDSLKG